MWRILEQKKQLEAEVGERTVEVRAEKARVEEQNREIHRLLREAQLASEAKSAFVANMSHEIRTPMNGVLGMLELTLDSELSVQQREDLDMACTSAEALLTVINDILEFSKIEAGKIELESIAFDLGEHLAQVLKALTLQAHKKGLDLTLSVSPEVPEQIVGDPARLRQVLFNLLGNAIKFTEHGTVRLETFVDSLRDDQARLHFMVRDTGIGISSENLLSVFEPFVQADNSTARKFGGTGLRACDFCKAGGNDRGTSLGREHPGKWQLLPRHG